MTKKKRPAKRARAVKKQGPVLSLEQLEERARRALEQNRAAIEATSRGTAGQQATTWRRGSSPGSVRVTR